MIKMTESEADIRSPDIASHAKKHEPVPTGFNSYAEKYDEQAEPGAFMTECWPVIKEFGDKKWLDQP